MDLRKLLGILNETTQNIQQPAEQAVQAMRTSMVKPGYEQAARDYESAFQRGDFNSPYIIGQDPANFGYPEDITTQPIRPVSRPMVQQPNPIRIAGLQALTNFRPNMPLNPQFGATDQWDVNSPDAIYPPNDPRSRSKFRY